MILPGKSFESPVPTENFFTEDGKWVFIKQSDHNKIMNYIKNTDSSETAYHNNMFMMKIDGLYYNVDSNPNTVRINEDFEVRSDVEPK